MPTLIHQIATKAQDPDAGTLEWEVPCRHAGKVVDFASGRWRGPWLITKYYSIGLHGKFAHTKKPKIHKNNTYIIYATPKLGIGIEFINEFM